MKSGCRGVQEPETSLIIEEANCPPGYCQIYANTSTIKINQYLLYRGGLEISIYFIIFCIMIFMAYYPSQLIDPVLCFFLSCFLSLSISYLELNLSFHVPLFLWMLHYLPYIPHFHVIDMSVPSGFGAACEERNGRYFLPPKIVLMMLQDLRHGYVGHGPANTDRVRGRDTDHVLALICSAPFPCITQYLARPRTTQWPSLKALEEIAILPGLLVATGKRGSVDHDWQWRQSYSPQEVHLAQDMPDWVKVAFRALKATMNSVKKRIDEEGSDTETKIVCSFYMKTGLLWLLEEADTWQDTNSFRLMIQLLVRIDHHLETGNLPHYFNPACDLLDNVPEKVLELTKKCVKVILNDPVDAMIKACAKSSRGLPIRLGKTVDYWLSPKCFLASVHSKFLSALVIARAQYKWISI